MQIQMVQSVGWPGIAGIQLNVFIFSVVIRGNRRLGAILIFIPEGGHVYLLVPQIVCKNPSVRKFKGLEVFPLWPQHRRETNVTLTCVVRAIHKGLGMIQLFAAYQSHLVKTKQNQAPGLFCPVDTYCWGPPVYRAHCCGIVFGGIDQRAEI